MPGDPLTALYGDDILLSMTPQLKKELVSSFGLDRSLPEQFFIYLINFIRGDLGYSYAHTAPVSAVIAGALPWTLLLSGTAVILSGLAGFFAGIESGYFRDTRYGKGLLSFFVIMHGIPDFFAGALLLLAFGAGLGLFPIAGAFSPFADSSFWANTLDIIHHIVLPVLSLVIARAGSIFLVSRSSMITTMREPFLDTARAKGCTENTVKYRHAAGNALLPVITVSGLHCGHILTGALFVEIVFSYPGLGVLLHGALLSRDYPLIQGILLIVALLVLTVNGLVEFLYTKIDPRIHHAH